MSTVIFGLGQSLFIQIFFSRLSFPYFLTPFYLCWYFWSYTICLLNSIHFFSFFPHCFWDSIRFPSWANHQDEAWEFCVPAPFTPSLPSSLRLLILPYWMKRRRKTMWASGWDTSQDWPSMREAQWWPFSLTLAIINVCVAVWRSWILARLTYLHPDSGNPFTFPWFLPKNPLSGQISSF